MFENETLCNKAHKPIMGVMAILVAVTLVVLIAFLSASTQYKVKLANNIEIRNIITVSGLGEIYTKPDLAVVNLSVVSEADTVDKAVLENTNKMNNVIKAIKGQGVKDEDLKTMDFSIYPRYEYKNVETEIYSYPPQKRVLVGYEITQTLEVRIRDLSKIGTILESGTSNGANEVGGLQMKIDNEDEFKNQAREIAINKAKQKAKELSEQVGVKLGKITNFSENYDYTPVYMENKAVGGAGPEIETGQNKIVSNVSISYEIE